MRWYLDTPLYAYRLARHWALAFQLRTLRAQIGEQSYAHTGEDVMLAKLFSAQSGYCVEVGANDGLAGSNTLLFERRGWRGLLVEADPEIAQICRRNRPAFTTTAAAAVSPAAPETVSFEAVIGDSQLSTLSLQGLGCYHAKTVHNLYATRQMTVPARTLDRLLEEANAPKIDFVTIDVEGYEWDVLQGFSPGRWQPEVIILERNGREQDPRILAYMSLHGYERFCVTPKGATHECNDWYRPLA